MSVLPEDESILLSSFYSTMTGKDRKKRLWADELKMTRREIANIYALMNYSFCQVYPSNKLRIMNCLTSEDSDSIGSDSRLVLVSS